MERERGVSIVSSVTAIALAVCLAQPAQANPKIRTAFFAVYTNAVGTPLDNLPSRAGHCGVCHYNFQGGGDPWNPYGQALRDQGGLGGQSGPSNAMMAIRFLDSDGDGFSSQTEITNKAYANTPTFPGLSITNLGLVQNVTPAEVQPYLTPTVGADTTPPSIVVTKPNGGESFVAGRYTNVTWTASDASGIAAIHIHESLDGGATFSPVILGLSNSGSYAWVPANRPTTNARIKVVAVDGAANTSNDMSNASFAITSPPGGRVPTTLRDFDMPGTQPLQGGSELAAPEDCAQCHGNYDAAVEPYRNWQGSMMAHASRDPLFEANMAIANQDAPESGDLCLRCHFSRGWLGGRSVPTDGSRMQNKDRAGVSCDLCHRMVNPVYEPGSSPAADTNILAALTFAGTNYGNGMFVIDPAGAQRGPFTNAVAPHAIAVSPFHRKAAFCGTCHDVSNPAFSMDANGVYQPNAFDARATNFSPNVIGPVERTFSEWVYSAYNSTGGVYAPQFAGNKDGGTVSTCQDCHMRDVTGYGCDTNINDGVTQRNDLPLHDMTGGSTWIPSLLTNLYPSEVNAAAIQAGIDRATYILENAASIGVSDVGMHLKVTVTNECGHKLPTGYPEGRRIWVNVRFLGPTNGLVSESGAYDASTGVLTRDTEAKVYEVHPGIDTNIAGIVGVPAGPSLHFVLNNRVYEDNRIPPRGFSNAAYAAFGGAPVGHHYDDGQFWDDSLYAIPPGAVRAEVRLYYQSTSKEFVEFLRDENTTNTKGQEMYNLWNANGKCPPTLMSAATQDLVTLNLVNVPVSVTNECGAVSAPPAVSAVGACATNPPVTFVETTNGASCPVAYTLRRVWSASDACSNYVSATQWVHVVDSQPPVFSAVPSNVTVVAAELPPPADIGATDACSTASVVFAQTTNATPDGYELVRVWTATDLCGHAASATQRVSVIDASDGDDDGMPGDWEFRHFGGPTNAVAEVDSDLDGIPNLDEYIADTDPTNTASHLHFTQIWPEGNQMLFDWQGGVAAWQWLEVYDPTLSGGVWLALSTNVPPTPVVVRQTNLIPGSLTNPWFRIRAGR